MVTLIVVMMMIIFIILNLITLWLVDCVGNSVRDKSSLAVVCT